MPKKLLVLLATLAIAATAHSARADDEKFAIRFGLILFEPTSETTVLGRPTKLERGYGGEFDFEWYFLRRIGLEGSVATAVDAELKNNDNDIAGVTVTPITVGLNGHVVRSGRVDWYIGLVAGGIFYSDFDTRSTTTTVTTDAQPTYGLQTAVDIGVAKQGRWGVNFGLKYLVADAEITRGLRTDTVAVDPLIVRAMGVFRW